MQQRQTLVLCCQYKNFLIPQYKAGCSYVNAGIILAYFLVMAAAVFFFKNNNNTQMQLILEVSFFLNGPMLIKKWPMFISLEQNAS